MNLEIKYDPYVTCSYDIVDELDSIVVTWNTEEEGVVIINARFCTYEYLKKVIEPVEGVISAVVDGYTLIDRNKASKTPLQNALDFLDDVKKTLQEKNKAYGDSAANPLRIFSKSDKDEAIKVRIDDKLSRIAKGDGSGNEDAIKDLVGYLALLAGMRK